MAAARDRSAILWRMVLTSVQRWRAVLYGSGTNVVAGAYVLLGATNLIVA